MMLKILVKMEIKKMKIIKCWWKNICPSINTFFPVMLFFFAFVVHLIHFCVDLIILDQSDSQWPWQTRKVKCHHGICDSITWPHPCVFTTEVSSKHLRWGKCGIWSCPGICNRTKSAGKITNFFFYKFCSILWKPRFEASFFPLTLLLRDFLTITDKMYVKPSMSMNFMFFSPWM